MWNKHNLIKYHDHIKNKISLEDIYINEINYLDILGSRVGEKFNSVLSARKWVALNFKALQKELGVSGLPLFIHIPKNMGKSVSYAILNFKETYEPLFDIPRLMNCKVWSHRKLHFFFYKDQDFIENYCEIFCLISKPINYLKKSLKWIFLSLYVLDKKELLERYDFSFLKFLSMIKSDLHKEKISLEGLSFLLDQQSTYIDYIYPDRTNHSILYQNVKIFPLKEKKILKKLNICGTEFLINNLNNSNDFESKHHLPLDFFDEKQYMLIINEIFQKFYIYEDLYFKKYFQ